MTVTCTEWRDAVKQELNNAGVPCLKVERVFEPRSQFPDEPTEILFHGRSVGDIHSRPMTALVRESGEPALIEGWFWSWRLEDLRGPR